MQQLWLLPKFKRQWSRFHNPLPRISVCTTLWILHDFFNVISPELFFLLVCSSAYVFHGWHRWQLIFQHIIPCPIVLAHIIPVFQLGALIPIYNVPSHPWLGTLPQGICSKLKFEYWCPLIIKEARKKHDSSTCNNKYSCYIVKNVLTCHA